MIKNVIIVGVLAATVSACSSNTSPHSIGYNSHKNESVGAISGAIAGGYIANKASGDNPVATLAGVLVGASLGTGVGRKLDEADAISLKSDNGYVERAGQLALITGEVQQWKNYQTGSWGVVTPSPVYNWTDNGQTTQCRTIYLKSVRNNLPHEGVGRACKVYGDSWSISKM